MSAQPIAARYSRSELLAGVAALLVGLTSFGSSIHRLWPFTVDDTFITLRYAQNLASGAGLTFNPGWPRAEGYTSISWAVLLSAPHLLGIDALLFAKWTGVACAIASIALTAWLARLFYPGESRGFLVPALAAGLFASAPQLAAHAVSGMETSLFVAVTVGFLAVLVRAAREPTDARFRWLALAGLALGLTRPEGNLVAALGLAGMLQHLGRALRPRLIVTVLLWQVIPGAAYFAWRWSYYGLPLPLPFYVKVASHHGPAGIQPVVAYLVTYGALIAVGMFFIRALTRDLIPALLAIVSVPVFFLFPEHLMGYEHRYLFCVTPIICALAALGVGRIWGTGSPTRSRLFALALATIAMAALARESRGVADRVLWYAHGLESAHLPLGRKLAEARARTHRCVLAIGDAGSVPYRSGCVTIDTFGLNEPEIARGRHDADYVLSRRPDALVLISYSREQFEPHLPWERELHDKAIALGMTVLDKLEFSPTYWLWVLQREPGFLGTAGKAEAELAE